jgi:hypothetical protein
LSNCEASVSAHTAQSVNDLQTKNKSLCSISTRFVQENIYPSKETDLEALQITLQPLE